MRRFLGGFVIGLLVGLAAVPVSEVIQEKRRPYKYFW